MKPDDLINFYQNLDESIFADTIMQEVEEGGSYDDNFFIIRFLQNFDRSQTTKGNVFLGQYWKTENQNYISEYLAKNSEHHIRSYNSKYNTLELSDKKGNPNSFRKSIIFERQGNEVYIKNIASAGGEGYGMEIVKNLEAQNIDIFEWENLTQDISYFSELLKNKILENGK